MVVWVLEAHKVTRDEYLARKHRPADDGDDVSAMIGVPIGSEVECLHCGDRFTLGSEKVDLRDGLLVCPSIGCDGTPLDWFPIP